MLGRGWWIPPFPRFSGTFYMTEDGHNIISNCLVRQTILYKTVFGHIRSAFFKSWEGAIKRQYMSEDGHIWDVKYCIVWWKKKKILTALQLCLCCLCDRILMDVTMLTIKAPWRKLLDAFLSMKQRLISVAGKLCVK